MDDLPLPVSGELLEMYRLDSAKSARSTGMGAHLTRRIGQSLEFREHVPFSLGDDIRFIDRVASERARARGSRNGVPWENWVSRRFQAEDRFKVICSIDTRETMRFPKSTIQPKPLTLSKFQVARWLVESIAHICLSMGDTVSVHSLFGGSHSTDNLQADGLMQQIHRQTDDDGRHPLNLAPLERLLASASIWIIISDLYAPPEHLQPLVNRIQSAQAGPRIVILIELDSWPYERHQLGAGARRIEGPDATVKLVDIDQNELAYVEAQIAQQRQLFQTITLRSHWQWPETFDMSQDITNFFVKQFTEDHILQKIFLRG